MTDERTKRQIQSEEQRQSESDRVDVCVVGRLLTWHHYSNMFTLSSGYPLVLSTRVHDIPILKKAYKNKTPPSNNK